MPIKLTEWLKDIIAPIVDKPEDAELFLSASDLKAVELPDDMVTKFNQKYLTRERALTDEQIIKKFSIDAKGKVFDSVDLKLKQLKGKLSQEDQDAIDAEKNTLIKLDLLNHALDNLGKNEDVKKINEAFRKKESEWHEKISSLENTLKEKDATFDKEIQGVKLDYALRSKVAGFKLAPEFSADKHKDFLADSTINNLKKNFILEFDEKDQSIIHLRKEVDGVITDVYEGNKQVTLNDVLQKEYEPYIAKSTPGHTPPPDRKVQVPTDRPLVNDYMSRIRANAEVSE